MLSESLLFQFNQREENDSHSFVHAGTTGWFKQAETTHDSQKPACEAWSSDYTHSLLSLLKDSLGSVVAVINYQYWYLNKAHTNPVLPQWNPLILLEELFACKFCLEWQQYHTSGKKKKSFFFWQDKLYLYHRTWRTAMSFIKFVQIMGLCKWTIIIWFKGKKYFSSWTEWFCPLNTIWRKLHLSSVAKGFI